MGSRGIARRSWASRGIMTLSSNGSAELAGSRGTWQISGNQVKITIMGAMQVPATQVSFAWNGSELLGTLVAYSYKLSGGAAERTGERRFPLSARRPEGYSSQDTTGAGTGQIHRSAGNSPSSPSQVAPGTAGTPVPANSGQSAERRNATEARQASSSQQDLPYCVSFGHQIQLNQYVCYASSMEQYVCRKRRGQVGFDRVQKLSLRSSLTDKNQCDHVDRSNNKPTVESLLD
jgi:hypothetical protein